MTIECIDCEKPAEIVAHGLSFCRACELNHRARAFIEANRERDSKPCPSCGLIARGKDWAEYVGSQDKPIDPDCKVCAGRY